LRPVLSANPGGWWASFHPVPGHPLHPPAHRQAGGYRLVMGDRRVLKPGLPAEPGVECPEPEVPHRPDRLHVGLRNRLKACEHQDSALPGGLPLTGNFQWLTSNLKLNPAESCSLETHRQSGQPIDSHQAVTLRRGSLGPDGLALGGSCRPIPCEKNQPIVSGSFILCGHHALLI
jgi:hypothetical protein